MIGIDRGLARRGQPLDPGAVERNRRRADAVADGRGRERAVKRQVRHHVAAGQIGQDRARRQQPRIDHEIAELVLAQVDQAIRRHRQRTRRQRHPRRRLALVERRADVDHHPARGQPLDRAGHVQARMSQAANRESAVGGAQVEIRKALPADRRQPLAAPRFPVAIAVDPDRERRFHPAHRRRDAVAGRVQRDLDRQLVVGGHRVERQPQLIAPGDPRPAQRIGIGDQLRTAAGDMRGAVDPDQVRVAGHRLRQHQPVHLQPVDINVDVGQDRRVRIAGLERGRTRHRDEWRLHRIQVDMVPQELERVPVDRGGRRREKDPVRVADAQVDQFHPAVDRPLDPPDLDVESAFGRIAREPRDDETMPRRGVETDIDQYQQRQDAEQGDPDPADDRLPDRLSHDHDRRRRVIGDGCLHHQNACPIDM